MIHLYYHVGSANHGCEAIVRSTAKLLEEPMVLWSRAPEEDIRYGIGEIVKVKSDQYKPVEKKTLLFFKCALEHKLLHSDYGFIQSGHKAFLNEVHPGDICMSIGGDNYCYPGVEDLAYYHRMLKERGAKTVLWGCSIEPAIITKGIVRDLLNYDLITVRESLSLEGLRNAGIRDNVVFAADPAFNLETADVRLPAGFQKETTIGVNVSPLVVKYNDYVIQNYCELMRYLIQETDYSVLLIPHVVKDNADDRVRLRQILEPYIESDRVHMVDDLSCTKLKGYISQCRVFIGARTHATIAAYSSYVPTLVVGYSVKARGISTDLFGTDRNYVLYAQEMNTPDDLKNAYFWLEKHAEEISVTLKNRIPKYKESTVLAKESFEKLLG